MHIISAVDEEKQIVHIKTDARTTDEQFNKSMSELMVIISNFHNPKLIIEVTEHADEKNKQSMKRLRTFNLETVKSLKKIAIFSVGQSVIFDEILEYCRNKDIPCKKVADIDHAKNWLMDE